MLPHNKSGQVTSRKSHKGSRTSNQRTANRPLIGCRQLVCTACIFDGSCSPTTPKMTLCCLKVVNLFSGCIGSHRGYHLHFLTSATLRLHCVSSTKVSRKSAFIFSNNNRSLAVTHAAQVYQSRAPPASLILPSAGLYY